MFLLQNLAMVWQQWRWRSFKQKWRMLHNSVSDTINNLLWRTLALTRRRTSWRHRKTTNQVSVSTSDLILRSQGQQEFRVFLVSSYPIWFKLSSTWQEKKRKNILLMTGKCKVSLVHTVHTSQAAGRTQLASGNYLFVSVMFMALKRRLSWKFASCLVLSH